MGTTIFAHDVNNDMFIIMRLVKVIESDLENGNVARAKESIQKLKSRANNIVDFLKSTMQREEEFDLREYVDHKCESVQEDYNLQINATGQSSFNVIAKQIFLLKFCENLLKNAHEAGATRIDVYFGRDVIIFKDNGEGFQKKVLESYIKHRRVTTKKIGNGLGLRSMNSFAKSIGGELEISNSILTGSGELKITFANLKKLSLVS